MGRSCGERASAFQKRSGSLALFSIDFEGSSAPYIMASQWGRQQRLVRSNAFKYSSFAVNNLNVFFLFFAKAGRFFSYIGSPPPSARRPRSCFCARRTGPSVGGASWTPLLVIRSRLSIEMCGAPGEIARGAAAPVRPFGRRRFRYGGSDSQMNARARIAYPNPCVAASI